MDFLQRIRIKPLLISVITIAGIVFLFILVFKIAFPIFKIPSASMEKTIMTGDYVITQSYKLSGLERGDVIVFKSNSEEKTLIKRVIGKAGDTVEIKDGKVSVNGHTTYYYLFNNSQRTEGEGTYEVPDGCVFVLGDNREHSKDSRYMDDPYIPVKNIIGVGIYSIGPSSGFHFKLLV